MAQLGHHRKGPGGIWVVRNYRQVKDGMGVTESMTRGWARAGW